MADAPLKKRLDLQLALNHCPRVTLADLNGTIRLDLRVDPLGSPSLTVHATDSKSLGSILVRADGDGTAQFSEGEEIP
jgi:hypothetical protein